jgi:hypothetical protein
MTQEELEQQELEEQAKAFAEKLVEEPIIDETIEDNPIEVDEPATENKEEDPIDSENSNDNKEEEEEEFDEEVSKYLKPLINNLKEEEKDPKVKELELKAKAYDDMVSDPIIVDYFQKQNSGFEGGFKEYLKQINPKEYGVNEETFRDYLKFDNPSMTSDEIDEEVYRYAPDGFDNLSYIQKKQIETFARELNTKTQNHNFGVVKQPTQEEINAAIEKEQTSISNYTKERVAEELKVGESTYTFTDKDVKGAVALIRSLSNPQTALNPDGTTNHLLFDMALIYLNHKKILTTISSSSNSKGKIDVLSKQANLKPNSSSSSMPTNLSNKPRTIKEQWALAQKAMDAAN